MARTQEPQYESAIELQDAKGLTSLGIMSNETWHDDPKRLGIMLSRYKFVAKMLQDREHVLEVGCADAFGTRIVLQAVHRLTAIDFDSLFVEDVVNRMDESWPFECYEHDMLSGPVEGEFDAAFALDVLEHIAPEHEDTFIRNLCSPVNQKGVVIFGVPSLESQTYASPRSKAGHVNCKTGEQMAALGRKYFHNAFIFSMNDEVLHTGFFPMSQYLFLLGVGKRC